MADLDYIRSIYRTDLGQTADDEGLNYWKDSGLGGIDLVKAMREAAGMSNELFADSAYTAFDRQRRHRELEIESDRLARTAALQRQRQVAGAEFDRQRDLGLSAIDREAESRGAYRTGGRLRKRGELVQRIAGERSRSELSSIDQEAELNRQAAAQVADLSRQRDEQEVAARRRLTQKSAMEAM